MSKIDQLLSLDDVEPDDLRPTLNFSRRRRRSSPPRTFPIQNGFGVEFGAPVTVSGD